MTDLHARLAENQRVIEAVPEVAWYGREEAEMILSHHGTSSEHIESDAALIAASRSEWPKANAALRKVLELHTDTGAKCAECDEYNWPCATVRAIEEAMSDDD